jgi:CheY-like chemotaxis protein
VTVEDDGPGVAAKALAPPVREVLPGRPPGRGQAARNGYRADGRRGPDAAMRGEVEAPQRAGRPARGRAAPGGAGSREAATPGRRRTRNPAETSRRNERPGRSCSSKTKTRPRTLADYLERAATRSVRPTAAEAMRQWDAHRADLVLLDLGLPDLDGVEVIRRIRREATTPIIILSARGDERDKIAGLEAGADDYLTKPFATDELNARIRAVLRRAGGATRTPKAACARARSSWTPSAARSTSPGSRSSSRPASTSCSRSCSPTRAAS